MNNQLINNNHIYIYHTANRVRCETNYLDKQLVLWFCTTSAADPEALSKCKRCATLESRNKQ